MNEKEFLKQRDPLAHRGTDDRNLDKGEAQRRAKEVIDGMYTQGLMGETKLTAKHFEGIIADDVVDNNPKAARALLDGKAPMDLIPLHCLAGAARVLEHGASKYGRRNWRIEPISCTTYVGAIMRHLQEWQDGHDKDKDSGEHPLSHVMASCLLVLDALRHGTLVDDRDQAEIKGV